MCAKYGSETEFNLLQKHYKLGAFTPSFDLPSGTIYPHDQAPVIYSNRGVRELALMNFSLVARWSKVRKPKNNTYNARIEEVEKLPTWRDPFKRSHCLIPVKNFIESAHFGRLAGHTFMIQEKESRILTAAGIWDLWLDRESGKYLQSFAIITKEPPKDILEAGHDRCPVFLPRERFDDWMNIDLKVDYKKFLQENVEDNCFDFKVLNKLKSYTGQRSFFDEE